MERFVFDLVWIRRISTVSAVLSGVAVYFFGAPFATVILVAAVESAVLITARDWYRRHGYRN